jgi:hypothetical protein
MLTNERVQLGSTAADGRRRMTPDPAMVLALIVMALVLFADVVVTWFVKRRRSFLDTEDPRGSKAK